MSLYNSVCGNNPLYQLYLAILSSETPLPEIPRFRDVWVQTEPELRIVIYTRTGGGNRESYAGENLAMQGHPLFVSDSDDEFDSTFANWCFRVPERFAGKVLALQSALSGLYKFSDPRSKFKQSLESLESGKPIPQPDVSEVKAKEIALLVEELANEVSLKA